LLYEVNQGRVHWAFYPGKGAKLDFCRFLGFSGGRPPC